MLLLGMDMILDGGHLIGNMQRQCASSSCSCHAAMRPGPVTANVFSRLKKLLVGSKKSGFRNYQK
jgi:hypothetical protein